LRVIRCQECGQPVAEVRGAMLVIRSRHHGREHVTLVPITQLVEQANREAIDTAPAVRYSLVSGSN
jgi:hypothetical protein